MNHCLEFTSAEFFFWLPSSKQEPITRHRIAIRRTIPLVPAVAALAIACAETVAPLPDSSGWSVIAAEIVAIPCVVATAHNGTVRTLAIGRDELPIPLPSLDSVMRKPRFQAGLGNGSDANAGRRRERCPIIQRRLSYLESG